MNFSEELKMVQGFRAYLKADEKEYSGALLAHFLAGISNNIEFRDIRAWGIMPYSGTKLNEDMLLFKDKAREMMRGIKKEPIFIRHTETWKSHDLWKNGSDRLSYDRHFETIIINPIYKKYLKGKIVCIFDDYLTNGTTFETARNLLIKVGVNKIFFVSLGRFGKNYSQQNYELTGIYTQKDINLNI